MKTKFLSKLMLIACTAVMIAGCDNKGQTSEDKASDEDAKNALSNNKDGELSLAAYCLVCDENEDHKISIDSAIYLIQTFDSAFVDKGIVSNAGGIIDFESSNNLVPNIIKTYPTFKFHWGFEKIGQINRLSITCHIKGEDCIDNIYQGKSGIEGTNLFGTFVENDFQLRNQANTKLTQRDINSHLISTTPFPISKPGENLIDSIEAVNLLDAFNRPANQLYKSYPCADIVFNIDSTLYKIYNTSKRYTLRYYFGYDARAHIKNKLRLILVGIDREDKLRIYDSSDKLLIRETSRPHP